ncbi:MAG: hypothetical protein V4621_00990 [Pseudomonadota bacterium]
MNDIHGDVISLPQGFMAAANAGPTTAIAWTDPAAMVKLSGFGGMDLTLVL